MKKKFNKLATGVVAFSVMSAVPCITPVNVAYAGNNIESEFTKTIREYSDDEIVVENGISLRKGEKLDLSKYPNWKLSNNDVVKISENGVVEPVNEGTVFLSQELGNKVHIIEIHVSNGSAKEYRSVERTSVDRSYYKVFVDPGHGGNDNGASKNGIYEDELNLKVAKKLEAILKNRGIEVKMSRNNDTYISLGERAKLANEYDADAFISIHQNSADVTTAHGIETYHHTNKTAHKSYSSEIQTKALKETNAKDRSVKSANFVVLRETSMVSSLFESGFITNEEEANKLITDEYQDKLATGIANGIENYLKENIKLNDIVQKPEEKPEVKPEVKPEEVIKKGTVNASSLNVRSGAGTSYKKLGSLSNGAKVEIVETKNGWHKIKYNGGYGYVSADYIKLTSTNTGSGSGSTTTVKKGTVNTSSLNVRSGAGTSYKKLGSLSSGAKVEIVETKNGWHKIKYNGGYGYVSADYIKLTSTNTGSNTGNSSGSTTTVKKGTVNTSSLNVRSGAGTSYKKLGSLSSGAKVEIVETKNGWHKIKYNGGYGYVSADYIKLTSTNTGSNTGNSSGSTTTVKKGTVNTSSLNVRSGAGTSYKKLGSLSSGAKVEIVETKNGWHKIKYNGGYGYVSADYIKL